MLTWKPRLPSRNWTIFFTVVGTISYLYYDDRKQCDRIKQEYIDRVKSRAQEPTSGSMDVIRKVKVMGALWPSDEDDDRALRHFRKYVKVGDMTATASWGRQGALERLATDVVFTALFSCCSGRL